MAKLPGYIKVGEPQIKNGKCLLPVTVNKWHPSFWWLFVCVFAQQLSRVRLRFGRH